LAGVIAVGAAAVVVAAIGLVGLAAGNGGATGSKTGTTSSTGGTQVSTVSDVFPYVAGSTTLSLEAATSYKPKAPPGGGTDDYHCTLVNPHVTTPSYIVASDFFPNSPEVHHAILFLIPPALAAEAELANGNGHGWTCFGETALPGQGLNGLGNTPWLAAWAPGHGLDQAPAGTGIPFPAGSLVVMQVHYNMLVGDAPVRVKLMLQTVPVSRDLDPLHLDLLPAPPDIPCPSGVTGPLCNRAASLANLGQRFGRSMVRFVDLLEEVCGRDPANPPSGDSTSCTWSLGFSGKILRLTPHMHLLGTGMKIVLDPGTPQQRTLLDVTNYDFNYQRSYNIAPVTVTPSDNLQVTCTYNPRLRQELPQLRQLPARYVTWGDGSSDEMCLAIVGWVS
jgi:Copper type II ascorbate-dependent monooxygenase, C-terminal domain